jgi:hypothetical protein
MIWRFIVWAEGPAELKHSVGMSKSLIDVMFAASVTFHNLPILKLKPQPKLQSLGGCRRIHAYTDKKIQLACGCHIYTQKSRAE